MLGEQVAAGELAQRQPRLRHREARQASGGGGRDVRARLQAEEAEHPRSLR
jgi:hypothetical protein